jgi:endonuclease YncB( thermonuclease family)
MGACISSSIHNNDTNHKKYTDNQINWAAVEYKDTVLFHPEITVAKCIKVYDGDTITIACGLPPYQTGNPVYRWSVRLRGIDSPEMRTKCASEKECALLAKQAMADQVLDQLVTLENVSYDKYGRVLANVFANGVNVADALLAQNLAVPYGGGTKQTPDDWLEFHRKVCSE